MTDNKPVLVATSLLWGFEPESRYVTCLVLLPIMTDRPLQIWEGVGFAVARAIEGLIASGVVAAEDRDKHMAIAQKYYEGLGYRWGSAS